MGSKSKPILEVYVLFTLTYLEITYIYYACIAIRRILRTRTAFFYDTNLHHWVIESRVSRQTNTLIFQIRSAEFFFDVTTVAEYYNILPLIAMSYPKRTEFSVTLPRTLQKSHNIFKF
jgi:hypothetical protein